ncbi:MAG TPA: hypothetical protein VHR97_05290 [Candidatus Baltobacteraceae bacterium]|jgi:5-methylcytosine-specific restriction endonuclease McrA|nr:hypothetical protein [Candidatus Baltobacteraceae bacterium]
MSWHSYCDAKTRASWRELLLLKQNGRCAVFGHRFPAPDEANASIAIRFAATFDHIVPRSQGGVDELRNDGSAWKPWLLTPRALRS